MIVLDVKQGSAAWHFARLGIPTASNFSRILTSKTRKLAAGSESYMHELLAEWLIGIPGGGDARGYMDRGTELEPWAVGYYELQRGISTTPVGVCLRDDRMAACSPDRLVGDDGGMEIKCPSAPKHVANMLDMSDEYFAQVQGNLWITGRKWWDLVSYHPEIPPVIVRIDRDPAYIAALEAAMGEFVPALHASRAKLIAMGADPVTSLAAEFVASLNPSERSVTSSALVLEDPF